MIVLVMLTQRVHRSMAAKRAVHKLAVTDQVEALTARAGNAHPECVASAILGLAVGPEMMVVFFDGHWGSQPRQTALV